MLQTHIGSILMPRANYRIEPSLLRFESYLALTTTRCPQVWHLLLPFLGHELDKSQAVKCLYRLVAPKPQTGAPVDVDLGKTRWVNEAVKQFLQAMEMGTSRNAPAKNGSQLHGWEHVLAMVLGQTKWLCMQPTELLGEEDQACNWSNNRGKICCGPCFFSPS